MATTIYLPSPLNEIKKPKFTTAPTKEIFSSISNTFNLSYSHKIPFANRWQQPVSSLEISPLERISALHFSDSSAASGKIIQLYFPRPIFVCVGYVYHKIKLKKIFLMYQIIKLE